MGSRSKRRTIAAETLTIIQSGEYHLPDGSKVSITDDVNRMIAETILYAPGDFRSVLRKRDKRIAESSNPTAPKISVENETTFAAASRLRAKSPDGSIMCLNFASAKNPGGGFLGGAQAQEECLARASALYASINPVQGYYQTNRRCGTCLYTDHMIYSPDVPVFRDDDDALLKQPYQVSILTAPAVNTGAVRRNEPQKIDQIADVMTARIEKVLALAIANDVRHLVLGAWGCGVFANDPTEVAQWFHDQLCERETIGRMFDEIVFAVLDRAKSQDNITAFVKQFG